MTPPNPHNGDPSVKWPLEYHHHGVYDANGKNLFDLCIAPSVWETAKRPASLDIEDSFGRWLVKTLNKQHRLNIYKKSSKYKALRQAYENTPEYKAKRKEYRQKTNAHRNEYNRRYNAQAKREGKM